MTPIVFYYVYVLRSIRDGQLYIGFSSDINQRLKQHNHGHTLSTRNRRPLRLIYIECFSVKSDALAREKYFKSGYGHKQLQEILKRTLSQFC
jgi:putative endonuclease